MASQQSARAAVACLLRNLELRQSHRVKFGRPRALLTITLRAGQELMDLAAEIEELEGKSSAKTVNRKP